MHSALPHCHGPLSCMCGCMHRCKLYAAATTCEQPKGQARRKQRRRACDSQRQQRRRCSRRGAQRVGRVAIGCPPGWRVAGWWRYHDFDQLPCAAAAIDPSERDTSAPVVFAHIGHGFVAPESYTFVWRVRVPLAIEIDHDGVERPLGFGPGAKWLPTCELITEPSAAASSTVGTTRGIQRCFWSVLHLVAPRVNAAKVL